MTVLKNGAIKFKSIKAAYEAAKRKNPELKYITFYARVKSQENKLGLGWAVGSAMARKPRQYQRRQQAQAA